MELSFSWGFLAPKLTAPLGYSTNPFLCTYNVLGMIACDLDSAASGTEWLPPPSSPATQIAGAGRAEANRSPGLSLALPVQGLELGLPQLPPLPCCADWLWRG